MDLYVFTFHQDGEVHRALAMLSPEEVKAAGLPTEAVLGDVTALLPSMTPDQFEPNPDFLEFLHRMAAEHAPTLPDLQAQAKAQATGRVHLVDGRATADNVTQADLIGQFDVCRGEIVADSYRPNEAYTPLTESGPIQLPPLLEEKLVTAVRDILAAQQEQDADAG